MKELDFAVIVVNRYMTNHLKLLCALVITNPNCDVLKDYLKIVNIVGKEATLCTFLQMKNILY